MPGARRVPDDVVQTDAGPLRAGVVIAADGTSSRLAREVGVRLSRVDLGLELELDAGSSAAEWADRVHLDWGPIPGSYAWVFPKGDTLTVGVIAARGAGEATRDYLRRFVALAGAGAASRRPRLRPPDPVPHAGLARSAAAGCCWPATPPGCSSRGRARASRSPPGPARWPARSAAAGATGAVERYRAALSADLLPEMAAGERCLRAFEARPWAFHELIRSTPVGWRQFGRITRGETTLARAVRRWPVRAGLGVLSLGTGPAPRPAA